MMKKYMNLFLIVFVIFVLAGCSNNNTNNTENLESKKNSYTQIRMEEAMKTKTDTTKETRLFSE